MKKILFCAGLMALAASCTQDELLNESVMGQSKGISFSATVPEDLNSRGTLYENNDKFPFFWHAEKDKIEIWGAGNLAANANNYGVASVGASANTDWTAPTGSGNPVQKAAMYKATKSEGNGQFTSVDDENLLEFATQAAPNETKATFVGAYAASIASVTGTADVTKLTLNAAQGNASQDLENNDVSYYTPMYSVSKGKQGATYESVGENINLEFYRPLAVARLKSNGITAAYKTLFGNLETITITTAGYTPGIGSTVAQKTASPIVYAQNAVITVDLTNLTDPTKTNVVAAGTEVTATYNMEWADGDIAFVALANVDRSAYRTDNVKETVVIEYAFNNITFTQEVETNADWKSDANGVLGVPALTISDYPYFVVDNGSSVALIVNSGNFADVFKNATTIDWGTSGVAVSSITEIYSHVALTADEQAKLQEFTALTKLELSAQTSLVKDALKGLYDTLEEVNMPLVTTIAEDFVDDAFSQLTTLKLGSYAFSNKKINDLFLSENTVEYLDASGVSTMEPVFGTEAALSFRNLTALEEIKVNNMALYSNAFNGCTGLTKVDGVVDITNAEYAFNGCTALTTVNISGTVIPRNAFTGCTSLTTVLKGTAQVAPTTVGESAFQGATSLETMDLANATTIGKNAFNASGLKYSSFTNATTYNEVVTVGATKIEEGAFANTELVFVNFKNATEVAQGILTGVSSLKHIKFEKVFTVVPATAAWTGSFGTNTSQVTLFVNAEQTYIDGSSLALPWTDNGTATTTSIPFGIIKK